MNFKPLFNFLKNNWPVISGFLVKHIWPIVKDKIIEAVEILLNWIMEKFRDIFSEENETLKETLEVRAEQAEQKAAHSDDQTEKQLNMREAQVLREVINLLEQHDVKVLNLFEDLIKEAKNKGNTLLDYDAIEAEVKEKIPALPEQTVKELTDELIPSEDM